jgi:TRAP-type C4-dicarboxylate transport system permease small subunit
MQTDQPGAFARAVGLLCRIVLCVATAVIFVILAANTVLRYATGASLQWANEVPELLFPWLVMAGVVLAALHGAHIATTFLAEAIPAAWRRAVAIATWLGVAAMYGTLSVSTFRMLDVVHDEKSPILQLPGSITYACVMGGMALLAGMALQSAWRAWQAPARAGRDGEQQAPAAHW